MNLLIFYLYLKIILYCDRESKGPKLILLYNNYIEILIFSSTLFSEIIFTNHLQYFLHLARIYNCRLGKF